MLTDLKPPTETQDNSSKLDIIKFESEPGYATIPAGPGSSRAKNEEKPLHKVLMHVNKFVHPVEKIPKVVEPEDIARWQDEYDKPEHARIAPQMKRIDNMFISLVGSVKN